MFLAHRPEDCCKECIAEVKRFESYLPLLLDGPEKRNFETALAELARIPIQDITEDKIQEGVGKLDNALHTYFRIKVGSIMDKIVATVRNNLWEEFLAKRPDPPNTEVWTGGRREYSGLHRVYCEKKKIGIVDAKGVLRPEVELAFLATRHLPRNYYTGNCINYVGDLISLKVEPTFM